MMALATGRPGVEQISPTFTPIFDMLGQLDEADADGRMRVPGESLHLLLPGVAEGFAGRGLAQKLVAECTAHGTRHTAHGTRHTAHATATAQP
jgi:hypothetical protein